MPLFIITFKYTLQSYRFYRTTYIFMIFSYKRISRLSDISFHYDIYATRLKQRVWLTRLVTITTNSPPINNVLKCHIIITAHLVHRASCSVWNVILTWLASSSVSPLVPSAPISKKWCTTSSACVPCTSYRWWSSLCAMCAFSVKYIEAVKS